MKRHHTADKFSQKVDSPSADRVLFWLFLYPAAEEHMYKGFGNQGSMYSQFLQRNQWVSIDQSSSAFLVKLHWHGLHF